MKLTADNALQFELAKHRSSKLKNAWNHLRNCVEIRKQRNQLADLTDEQLADIGVSREDALREANRSFTDLPKGMEIDKRTFRA